MGFDSFLETLPNIRSALEKLRSDDNYMFAALLVTDINTQNSLLLVAGDSTIVRALSHPLLRDQDDVFDLHGIVSRKKQLIPQISGIIRDLKSDGALPVANNGRKASFSRRSLLTPPVM